jgi:hypothetical protein
MLKTPGKEKTACAGSYQTLLRQAESFLGSIIKGPKGPIESTLIRNQSEFRKKKPEERMSMEVIKVPSQTNIDDLDEAELDDLSVKIRKQVEKRVIDVIRGKDFSKEQEVAMCHWILSNGKKEFLQKVFHFSGFDSDDKFISDEPFNGVHNAAVMRERYRSKKKLVGDRECNSTENRVSLRNLCLVGQSAISYDSIGISENVFTSGLFEEEVKIEIEEALKEKNVSVRKFAAEKSFIQGHSRDAREAKGSRRQGRFGESSIKEESFNDASSEAFEDYDSVVEQVRELIEVAGNAQNNSDKFNAVEQLRSAWKSLKSAYSGTQKFIDKSLRSEHQMIEEYRNISIIINRAIMRLLGIDDQSKLDLIVDIPFIRNGQEVFLQKKLPPNFVFLPPHGRDNPFCEASRKNQSLTKFPFDGSTSFNSWACQIRDGVWRIPEKMVHAARKYEHIRKECLDGEAREEFTGGVSFVTNYEMELVNGMERLQIKYGLTLSSFSKLLTELQEIRFNIQRMDELKRNLTRLQGMEEQMVNACPTRDPQEIAGMVYDHLKEYMDHTVWSEVNSFINSNCQHMAYQGLYSNLLSFSLMKCREILSRESFQKGNMKSGTEEVNRAVAKRSSDNRVSFADRKRSNEKGEKMRKLTECEIAEESETNARRVMDESDESSEDDELADGDEAEIRKFGDNKGGQGNQRSKGRSEYQPSVPLGYGMVNGEKKKIVDFERVKSSPCFLCERKEHGLMDCPLSVARKMMIIEDKSVCTRCFKLGHLIGECQVGRDLPMYCQLCKRKGHWDVLCWSTMNKKMLEERKRKQGEKKDEESKARKLTSDIVIGNDPPRKYREDGSES